MIAGASSYTRFRQATLLHIICAGNKTGLTSHCGNVAAHLAQQTLSTGYSQHNLHLSLEDKRLFKGLQQTAGVSSSDELRQPLPASYFLHHLRSA